MNLMLEMKTWKLDGNLADDYKGVGYSYGNKSCNKQQEGDSFTSFVIKVMKAAAGWLAPQ